MGIGAVDNEAVVVVVGNVVGCVVVVDGYTVVDSAAVAVVVAADAVADHNVVGDDSVVVVVVAVAVAAVFAFVFDRATIVPDTTPRPTAVVFAAPRGVLVDGVDGQMAVGYN